MGKKAESSLTHLLLPQKANSSNNSYSLSKCPIFWVPYNKGTLIHYGPEISSAAHLTKPPALFPAAGITPSEFAVETSTLSSSTCTARRGSE